MTSRPLRAVLAFVVALAVLAGGCYAAQQALVSDRPALELSPAQPFSAPPAPVRAASQSAYTARDPDVPVLDAAWVRDTAARSGLPEAALVAYARAELTAPRECGLGWTTLAGIGWVESQHGTLDGRTLGADGHPSEPILGPALDGGPGVKAIRATAESTAWHGDPTWDHAVGPMQFIPSTWERWASDGDGDGVRDPHDLDDAARAAARYLCADGHDLTTPSGWTGAILSYNNARFYLDAVHAAASSYAERVGARS